MSSGEGADSEVKFDTWRPMEVSQGSRSASSSLTLDAPVVTLKTIEVKKGTIAEASRLVRLCGRRGGDLNLD